MTLTCITVAAAHANQHYARIMRLQAVRKYAMTLMAILFKKNVALGKHALNHMSLVGNKSAAKDPSSAVTHGSGMML